MGPVVERAQRLLGKAKSGYIAVTDTIVDEINKSNITFVQDIATQRSGDMFDTSRNEKLSVHTVTIKTLIERDGSTLIEDYDHQCMLSSVLLLEMILIIFFQHIPMYLWRWMI